MQGSFRGMASQRSHAPPLRRSVGQFNYSRAVILLTESTKRESSLRLQRRFRFIGSLAKQSKANQQRAPSDASFRRLRVHRSVPGHHGRATRGRFRPCARLATPRHWQEPGGISWFQPMGIGDYGRQRFRAGSWAPSARGQGGRSPRDRCKADQRPFSRTFYRPRKLNRQQRRASLIHSLGASDKHFRSALAARPFKVRREQQHLARRIRTKPRAHQEPRKIATTWIQHELETEIHVSREYAPGIPAAPAPSAVLGVGCSLYIRLSDLDPLDLVKRSLLLNPVMELCRARRTVPGDHAAAPSAAGQRLALVVRAATVGGAVRGRITKHATAAPVRTVPKRSERRRTREHSHEL